jgi:hypothetical protein
MSADAHHQNTATHGRCQCLALEDRIRAGRRTWPREKVCGNWFVGRTSRRSAGRIGRLRRVPRPVAPGPRGTRDLSRDPSTSISAPSAARAAFGLNPCGSGSRGHGPGESCRLLRRSEKGCREGEGGSRIRPGEASASAPGRQGGCASARVRWAGGPEPGSCGCRWPRRRRCWRSAGTRRRGCTLRRPRHDRIRPRRRRWRTPPGRG